MKNTKLGLKMIREEIASYPNMSKYSKCVAISIACLPSRAEFQLTKSIRKNIHKIN